MLKPILIWLFFLISSCSSNDKDQITDDQSFYSNNTFQDYELFDKAKKLISNKQYDLALSQLDKIEILFPSSEFSSKSMLLKAYVNFLLKDYEKTRVLAESYIKYNPGSEDIAYALYLDAMTYYISIKKSNYSQENGNKALEKFTYISNNYQNSKYEIDIITKIEIINNNLAEGKVKIAKYYLDNKNDTGALIYFLDIFENHSSSQSIEETLFYLTKIYNNIEEPNLAKKYASILAYNFPDSIWYKKSYNIINDIENIEDDVSWYESLNPIKLFKSKLQNDSNDTDIKILN